MPRPIRPSVHFLSLNRSLFISSTPGSSRTLLLAALVAGGSVYIAAATGLYAQEVPLGDGPADRAMTEMTPDAMELPEVHVIDVRTPIFRDQDAPDDPSYTRENASTANRSNVPIMQTPIAVQVVPRAVLRDQQAIQIGDAVKNVSGVFPGFTFGGLAEEFMIRGFNTGYVSYRDGFRVPAVRLSLANIERVEVVKGAAANLYGRVEPGGMINLVTKRPQAESYYSLQQRFGSYAEYQTLADATGKLNQSGTLLYRINFEYLNKESYRDFGFHTRTFAAPTVTWRVTERTQLDVDFMYSGEGTREDYGIVALGTGPAPLPRSRFLGEPTDKVRMDVYNSVASLTHAFTADWQARARFNYFRRNVGDPQTFGTSLNELTGELQRGFYRGNAVNNTYMGTVDLTGKFVTGPLAHKMLAGWEYYGNFAKVNSISADASPINIFTPQYSTNNQSLQPYNFFIDQKVDWTGLYAQDQITLFDKLHLLGGGRYDWASQGTGTAFGTDQSLASAAAAVKTINNSRFSPRAGIVYQPWEWLSFYGNYAQSLGAANAAFDASGNTLKPEIGEQFEGGVKTSFFGGRLHSSVAVYQLTKQNMAVPVAGLPFSTPIGEARSKGIEVDVSGQIAQGLSLVMTYAYTDARSLTGDNEGKRLWNVPTNAGSLWARYEPQARLWQGLSLGAGVFVQDKRAGDNTNTFYLPSQARVDAMVRYRPSILESRLSFQLNAYNLANDYLYGGTLNDRFSLNVDIPRMFIGSIQYAL